MYFTIDPASGGYRAHAYGNNHRLIFWTEVYTSKEAALQAINIMKAGAYAAPVYDRA